MAKDLNISRLCDTYGMLLTEHMRDMIRNYYDYDLSLAEIAENSGVTRQAVLAGIRQAENKLKEYESVIGAVSRTDKLVNELRAVYEQLKSSPEAASSRLTEIIDELSER